MSPIEYTIPFVGLLALIFLVLLAVGFVALLVRLLKPARGRQDDARQEHHENKSVLSLPLVLVSIACLILAVGMFGYRSTVIHQAVRHQSARMNSVKEMEAIRSAVSHQAARHQSARMNSDKEVEAIRHSLFEPRIQLEVESSSAGGLPPEPEALAVATTEVVEMAHPPTAFPAKAVAAPTQPTAAPAWINQSSGWEGTKGDLGRIYHETVISDPWTTIEDCEQQLNQKLIIAVSRFVHTNYDEKGGLAQHKSRLLSLARDLRLTPGMIRAEIVNDTFVEDYDSVRVGRTMKRVHMHLVFDQGVREDLQQRLHEFDAQKEARWAIDNLIAVCLIALAVLAVLGTVYALLQFDTATKGYYTKRMLIGGAVVAMLLAIFVAIGAS